MILLFVYLCVALIISFMCSVMEAVLLSASVSYVEMVANESEGGKLLKKLKDNIDRPISAILSINTMAHTIGAAGVGAQVTKIFGNEYFGIASVILTLLILILSEILPKSIGTTYWRKICIPVAYIIRVIIFIGYPFVLLSKVITKLISKKDLKSVSREEIAALSAIGEREGVLESNESKIINNLIKLKSIKLKSIITPRIVVLAAPEDYTLEKFFNNKEFLRYSRIPIYTESIDDITGFVLKSDILLHLANDDKGMKLKELRRPIINCYENTSITKFYDMMITKKEHIALVIDEYGGMEGIATLEDVIETILGLEITDESDVQIDMQKFAKERWKIKAQKMGYNE